MNCFSVITGLTSSVKVPIENFLLVEDWIEKQFNLIWYQNSEGPNFSKSAFDTDPLIDRYSNSKLSVTTSLITSIEVSVEFSTLVEQELIEIQSVWIYASES